jgi:hypothetical protein
LLTIYLFLQVPLSLVKTTRARLLLSLGGN